MADEDFFPKIRSLQRLFVTLQKTAVLIIDAEKVFDVLCLAMAILCESEEIPLNVTRLEVSDDITIMSDFRQVSSTVATVGNRTREIIAALFSFIRQHLVLTAPQPSVCFNLGGVIFKMQTSGRCGWAIVSYGTTFASVTRLRSRSFTGTKSICVVEFPQQYEVR
ncbi:unnamed protein product [Heligmosomoides polygyrus]|uniref:Uncharacterized protein n=1 Tax=Heligmosomoides polygyrus TaxID=6339 RepID=A0A183FJ91_HELPZ|nr:unnamed protein product [Heligmosomoides polygyrus]